jgi:hypothetical protein
MRKLIFALLTAIALVSGMTATTFTATPAHACDSDNCGGSRPPPCVPLDCFAALAMTILVGLDCTLL